MGKLNVLLDAACGGQLLPRRCHRRRSPLCSKSKGPWKWVLICQGLALVPLLCLTLACSRSEKLYSHQEIWDMAVKVEPSIKLLVANANNPVVDCLEYGEGCLQGVTAEWKGLTFVMVQFSSHEKAKLAAAGIDAFYFANWIFDDVSGEPLLEEFIQKAYPVGKWKGIPPATLAERRSRRAQIKEQRKNLAKLKLEGKEAAESEGEIQGASEQIEGNDKKEHQDPQDKKNEKQANPGH